MSDDNRDSDESLIADKKHLKRRRSEETSDDARANKKRLANGHEECVAILDAGAQYGKVCTVLLSDLCDVNKISMYIYLTYMQIIDRRIRELFVRTTLLPLNTPAAKLSNECYRYLCCVPLLFVISV